jgi:hypothetical protein
LGGQAAQAAIDRIETRRRRSLLGGQAAQAAKDRIETRRRRSLLGGQAAQAAIDRIETRTRRILSGGQATQAAIYPDHVNHEKIMDLLLNLATSIDMMRIDLQKLQGNSNN